MPRDTAYTVEPYLYLCRGILERRVSQQIAQTSRRTEVKPWIPAFAGMTSKSKSVFLAATKSIATHRARSIAPDPPL